MSHLTIDDIRHPNTQFETETLIIIIRFMLRILWIKFSLNNKPSASNVVATGNIKLWPQIGACVTYVPIEILHIFNISNWFTNKFEHIFIWLSWIQTTAQFSISTKYWTFYNLMYFMHFDGKVIQAWTIV